MLAGRRILLIIGGGIAAYKSLELIRLLQKAGPAVVPVLTAGGRGVRDAAHASRRSPASRCTPRSSTSPPRPRWATSSSSRSADLVVVAPATADLIAKLAAGLANDLASTLLLATDKRVLLAPAMNVRMWQHPATRRNLAAVRADGALVVGPDEGEMACGEYGPGRMAEPPAIVAAIDAALGGGPLAGPARARHLRPDPRADRPGALHRQPLLGPPGQRHRRGAGPPRRPRHLRHRPGRGAAAEGCHRRRGGDRARDARRRRGGAARRRRGLRRRRRRLACGRRARLAR